MKSKTTYLTLFVYLIIGICKLQVFGGDTSLMNSGAREYIDSSRAVDITQMDMKQAVQHKSKEAKKFAKVVHKTKFPYT